jgi:predicted peptidase
MRRLESESVVRMHGCNRRSDRLTAKKSHNLVRIAKQSLRVRTFVISHQFVNLVRNHRTFSALARDKLEETSSEHT